MTWLTVGTKGVPKMVLRVFNGPLASDPGLGPKAEVGEHRQAAVAHLSGNRLAQLFSTWLLAMVSAVRKFGITITCMCL